MNAIRTFGAAAMLAGSLLLSSGAASAAVNGMDRTFVMKAGQGGLGEVAAGNLALSKMTGPAVRRIASRMVSDHGLANRKLATIAMRKGLSVPSGPGMSDRMMMAKLRPLNGAAFSRAYLKGQQTAHEQTIALFQQEVAKGSDMQLIGFANSTLPTIRMHLMMIRQARM